MTLADDACLPAARPLATALCKQTPRCPYLTPSHPLNIKGLFIYLQPASILATALTYRYSPAPRRCSCSCNAPPPCIIHSRPLPLSPCPLQICHTGPMPRSRQRLSDSPRHPRQPIRPLCTTLRHPRLVVARFRHAPHAISDCSAPTLVQAR